MIFNISSPLEQISDNNCKVLDHRSRKAHSMKESVYTLVFENNSVKDKSDILGTWKIGELHSVCGKKIYEHLKNCPFLFKFLITFNSYYSFS